MFKLFRKKIEVPRLSYIVLRVNISALTKWYDTQNSIQPEPEKSSWNDSEIKEYKITVLPIENYTFYHNNVNEFSPSLDGSEIFQSEPFQSLEWGRTRSHFYVNVSYPRICIFSVPLNEIFHLLITGETLSNTLSDEEVVSMGCGEIFDSYYRQRSPSNIKYSNELVSLRVIVLNTNNCTLY